MTVRATLQKGMNLAGVSFNSSVSPVADAAMVEDVSIAPGLAGTLTTRTNDTDGEFTTTGANTITTGQRIVLYWDGGSCRVTACGTVDVKKIPFTDAVGDALPVQGTACTIIVPTLLDMAVLGTDVDVILLYSESYGQFTFVKAESALVYHVVVTAKGTWDWTEDSGIENPITGETLLGVYVSHGEATAQTMRVGMLYNN
jgi:hypothetical protein